MLNYIITVAISAFFVPHYLGVFWEPLGESPADIVGGIVVVAAGVAERDRRPESAGLNVFLALADFLTQVVLVVIGVVLVLSPETLVDNVDFGTSPTLSDFLIAIPVGMVAYTGIETISNMAEEARDYGKTIPRAMGWWWSAVIGDLRVPAGGRAVGDAGRERADGAGSQGGGRLRRRPDPGRGGEPRPRRRSSTRPRSTSASWRRRSCSSRPTPG